MDKKTDNEVLRCVVLRRSPQGVPLVNKYLGPFGPKVPIVKM